MDVVGWGSVMAVASTVLFPAQRRNQPHVHARRDAARALLRDPVFYLGAALLAFMAFQALNNGRPEVYNVSGARWARGAPPWPGFPSSLDAGAAWRLFFTFLPAVAAALCARHGMAFQGRFFYLGMLACLSALVAAWEVGVSAALGGRTDGWRVFANADHGGVWFLLCLGVSVALWGRACASGQPSWARGVFLACAFLNVAGMRALRAPAALWLAGCAGVPLAWATLAVAWKSLAPARRAAALAVLGGVLPLVVFGAALGTPRVESGPPPRMDAGEGRKLKMDAAWKMAADHRLYGVGGGNYPRFAAAYWPAGLIREYRLAGIMKDNEPAPWMLVADNDYAQALAEFGVAGASIMLAAWFVLLRPAWRGWRGATAAGKCLCVVFLAGVGLVFAAAWAGSPLRSPPVLVSVAAALACAPAFLLNPLGGDDAA